MLAQQQQCDQEWNVSSTADANVLSEALKGCESGTFSVLWTGHVVVEQEIAVANGTSLSISGMNLGADAAAAAADGNGSTSLFSVENATLNIESMILMNGFRNGTGGGAILSDGGGVHISGATVFEGNECLSSEETVDTGGGAVLADAESNLTWTGDTIFRNNTASNLDGGALSCSHSTCNGTGTTLFEANSGAGAAGAVTVRMSNFSCEGTTTFIDNVTPGEGGAFFAADGSVAVFYGTTNATGNAAGSGGAFGLAGDLLPTSLGFTGTTTIANNTAEGDGGGMAMGLGCRASWEGAMAFADNVAGDDGGGLAMDGDSLLSIGGNTSYTGNSAGSKGGAVYANANLQGVTYDGVVFENNWAVIGGAIASYNTEESDPNIFTGCTFRNNIATSTGGAIEISVGDHELSSSSFFNNVAGTEQKTNLKRMTRRRMPCAMFRAPTNSPAKLPVAVVFCLRAGGGGALRLSGTARMENLVFEGNMATQIGCAALDVTAGPAVSNLGTLSAMTNITFTDNTFFCRNSTYVSYVQVSQTSRTPRGVPYRTRSDDQLQYKAISTPPTFPALLFFRCEEGFSLAKTFFQVDRNTHTHLFRRHMHVSSFFFNTTQENEVELGISRVYSAVCIGCLPLEGRLEEGNQHCSSCTVENPDRVPQECLAEPEGTHAAPGSTLETLEILPGWYRATNSTAKIFRCYNEDACLGGATGAEDFCADGYTGPCEWGMQVLVSVRTGEWGMQVKRSIAFSHPRYVILATRKASSPG